MMKKDVFLEKINENGVKRINQLAHLIWPDTFSAILSKAQISYMLDWMYNEETLKTQIQEGHEFMLIKDQNQDLGFIGVEKQGETLKIHKLYVLPAMQGKGLGKKLFNWAKSYAQANDCESITLNVNRYNKAQYFYESQGMKKIKEEDINIGNGYLMEDYVYLMEV